MNDDARMAASDTEYGAAMRQVYFFGGASAGTVATMVALVLCEAIDGTSIIGLVGASAMAVIWAVVSCLAWRRAARSLG